MDSPLTSPIIVVSHKASAGVTTTVQFRGRPDPAGNGTASFGSQLISGAVTSTGSADITLLQPSTTGGKQAFRQALAWSALFTPGSTCTYDLLLGDLVLTTDEPPADSFSGGVVINTTWPTLASTDFTVPSLAPAIAVIPISNSLSDARAAIALGRAHGTITDDTQILATVHPRQGLVQLALQDFSVSGNPEQTNLATWSLFSATPGAFGLSQQQLCTPVTMPGGSTIIGASWSETSGSGGGGAGMSLSELALAPPTSSLCRLPISCSLLLIKGWVGFHDPTPANVSVTLQIGIW